MNKTEQAPQPTMNERLGVLEQAKLRMLYIELAIEADKSGLSDAYRRYMNRAEEARERHDELKAGLERGAK